jgi:hypothetical protein
MNYDMEGAPLTFAERLALIPEQALALLAVVAVICLVLGVGAAICDALDRYYWGE